MNEDDSQISIQQITPKSTPRSSGSSISPSTSSSSASGNTKTIISEWLCYLQSLNNLCLSGYKLAQSISSLESDVHDVQGPSNQISYQIILAWDELAKSTTRATGMAKSHIVSILQDFVTQEHDLQKAKDHSQMVIQESFQTLVNLQYQFSIASCEFFAQMCYFFVEQPTQLNTQENRSQTPSPAQSSDHGNLDQGPSPNQHLSHLDNIRGPLPPPGHLITMKTPYRGSRSPLNFPLFPSNSQRRWSETAAVQSASGEDAESQARRWSMPWENKCDKQTRIHIPKLVGSINKSGGGGGGGGGSTTDSSVDGLTEAIQLLSCKPVQKTVPFQNSLGTSFEESQQTLQQQGIYGWQSTRFQQINFLKQMKENKMSFEENIPP